MGVSLCVWGTGPRLPRLDLQHGEPADEATARAKAEPWVEGLGESLGTGTVLSCGTAPPDEIGVCVVDETVLLCGLGVGELDEALFARAVGLQVVFAGLLMHSVTDLCLYQTLIPELDPHVVGRLISPEEPPDPTEAVEGLLPFERPYWRGEHRDGDRLFHPLTVGEAALAWFFGLVGEDPMPDEVMASLGPLRDIDALPVHRFALT